MELDEILKKHNITEQELNTILSSSRGHKPNETVSLDLPTKHFKYGYFSDPHIGHKEFKENVFHNMMVYFNQQGVDFVVNSGDTLEGMSNRPGHFYELEYVGFNEQINKAVELLSQIKAPIYGIDGNHDGWYFKPQNMGVIIGEELQRRIPNYKNLGQMEGNLEPVNNLVIKLFHANDGTAYADSYKLQKLIESFSGGEKPSIVHSGHYHKSLYLFRRNVHGFESATLCGQTEFMRGKKIQAHVGFGIVDVYANPNGTITDLTHKFIPYYGD